MKKLMVGSPAAVGSTEIIPERDGFHLLQPLPGKPTCENRFASPGSSIYGDKSGTVSENLTGPVEGAGYWLGCIIRHEDWGRTSSSESLPKFQEWQEILLCWR